MESEIEIQIPTTNDFSDSPYGQILKYVETDEITNLPTGRFVTFLIDSYVPLGYSDLANHTLGQANKFPLTWRNARILEEAGFEIDENATATGHAIMSSTYATGAVALVDGGWLPAGLMNSEDIILPDRCTLSAIISRFKHGGIRNKQGRDDFLDLILTRNIRINPALFALEGNARRNPDSNLVEQQLTEAYTKLQTALPSAQLVPGIHSGYDGIVGIINETQSGMHAKQLFLMEAAPKLRAPVSRQRKELVWREILAIADKHDVPKTSPVVIAALSTISAANGRNPAKKLLKVGVQHYTAADAYNALSDLRALEILICLFGLETGKRLALWTSDKNLAMFWSGIRASGFGRSDRWHCNFSPVDELFSEIPHALLSELLDVS